MNQLKYGNYVVIKIYLINSVREEFKNLQKYKAEGSNTLNPNVYVIM